jgi:hypothetical protein
MSVAERAAVPVVAATSCVAPACWRAPLAVRLALGRIAGPPAVALRISFCRAHNFSKIGDIRAPASIAE